MARGSVFLILILPDPRPVPRQTGILSFRHSSTAFISGTLVMPPCFKVDRLAAAQAKRTMSLSSSPVKREGAFSYERKRLMALPPKISPAPVVSTARMPEGLETVTAPF